MLDFTKYDFQKCFMFLTALLHPHHICQQHITTKLLPANNCLNYDHTTSDTTLSDCEKKVSPVVKWEELVKDMIGQTECFGVGFEK